MTRTLGEHADGTLDRDPDWCARCMGDGPLRPWPLPNQWGDRNELVCDRCWLKRVRGGVETVYTGWHLTVWTTHPQHGELLRGIIRAEGIEPGGLRPAIRWHIQDQDAVDLGTHVGDYADAEARLLAETSWADQIDTDDEEW